MENYPGAFSNSVFLQEGGLGLRRAALWLRFHPRTKSKSSQWDFLRRPGTTLGVGREEGREGEVPSRVVHPAQGSS